MNEKRDKKVKRKGFKPTTSIWMEKERKTIEGTKRGEIGAQPKQKRETSTLRSEEYKKKIKKEKAKLDAQLIYSIIIFGGSREWISCI